MRRQKNGEGAACAVTHQPQSSGGIDVGLVFFGPAQHDLFPEQEMRVDGLLANVFCLAGKRAFYLSGVGVFFRKLLQEGKTDENTTSIDVGLERKGSTGNASLLANAVGHTFAFTEDLILAGSLFQLFIVGRFGLPFMP